MSEIIKFNNDLTRTFELALIELIDIINDTLALGRDEIFLRFYPFMEQEVISDVVTQLWINKVETLRGDLMALRKDHAKVASENRDLVELFINSSRLNLTVKNQLIRRPTLILDEVAVTLNLIKIKSDELDGWALSDYHVGFAPQWCESAKELFQKNTSKKQPQRHYFCTTFQSQLQTGFTNERD